MEYFTEGVGGYGRDSSSGIGLRNYIGGGLDPQERSRWGEGNKMNKSKNNINGVRVRYGVYRDNLEVRKFVFWIFHFLRFLIFRARYHQKRTSTRTERERSLKGKELNRLG